MPFGDVCPWVYPWGGWQTKKCSQICGQLHNIVRIVLLLPVSTGQIKTYLFTDSVKTKKLTGHRTRLANSHRFRHFFNGIHRYASKNSPVTGVVAGYQNFHGCGLSGGHLSPEWVVEQSLVTGVGSQLVNCHRSESVIFIKTSLFTDSMKTKKLTGHRTRLANSHRFRFFFNGIHRYASKNSPVTGVLAGYQNFHERGLSAAHLSPEWIVRQSIVTGVGSRLVNCHRSESVIFHRSEQDLRFFPGVWTFFTGLSHIVRSPPDWLKSWVFSPECW